MKILGLGLFVLFAMPRISLAASTACSAAKINELLEDAATSGKSTVDMNCSVRLPRAYRITKMIRLRGAAASGAQLDLRGSTLDRGDSSRRILIESKKSGTTWSRPENISIKNATVHGPIRIRAMTADDLRAPSRQAGFTALAQAAAPRRINLQNLHLVGGAGVPLYLEPGVTNVRFEDSTISGTSTAVAIYLDAEGGGHVIRNNRLRSTNGREVLAIDGSANNIIANNEFSGLNEGGIYVYRNCGERSVSRHQPPRRNAIMNNTFYYKSYYGPEQAVFLGSRQGKSSYCSADGDSKYGSGISDLDFARENAVVGNQILDRNVSTYIRNNDLNNIVSGNITVSAFKKRAASCYLFASEKKIFADGQHTDRVLQSGKLVCDGYRYTCNDGEFVRTAIQCGGG